MVETDGVTENKRGEGNHKMEIEFVKTLLFLLKNQWEVIKLQFECNRHPLNIQTLSQIILVVVSTLEAKVLTSAALVRSFEDLEQKIPL
jgi:hypothetical protein